MTATQTPATRIEAAESPPVPLQGYCVDLRPLARANGAATWIKRLRMFRATVTGTENGGTLIEVETVGVVRDPALLLDTAAEYIGEAER